MTILIISAVFPPEPVVSAKLSADLYSELKERGYYVRVLHPRPSRPNGFEFEDMTICEENEVTTQSFVCPHSSLIGRIRESWSFGCSCYKHIILHHAEISCIYVNAWPIFSQLFIVKAAKKYGIPCIIHIQDIYPESLTNKMPGKIGKIVYSLFLPIDRYILDNCTKVVAISNKMKNYLAQTRDIDSRKIFVVSNWQNEKEFLNYRKGCEKKHTEKPFTFMYLGNIGPVAGVDLLLDAYKQSKLMNARLVIAGSGTMKKSLVEKAAGCKTIEFWDVPNGKVPEIQSQADVMILPIKKGAASSSIPSKLPAYMFSAKPIIGCLDADSDTANAISEAECGWIIEPENAGRLASMMEIVTSLDETCLKEKSDKAFSYGISHFSKKENLDKLVKVIEDAL